MRDSPAPPRPLPRPVRCPARGKPAGAARPQAARRPAGCGARAARGAFKPTHCQGAARRGQRPRPAVPAPQRALPLAAALHTAPCGPGPSRTPCLGPPDPPAPPASDPPWLVSLRLSKHCSAPTPTSRTPSPAGGDSGGPPVPRRRRAARAAARPRRKPRPARARPVAPQLALDPCPPPRAASHLPLPPRCGAQPSVAPAHPCAPPSALLESRVCAFPAPPAAWLPALAPAPGRGECRAAPAAPAAPAALVNPCANPHAMP
jgi:hypothetical protein